MTRMQAIKTYPSEYELLQLCYFVFWVDPKDVHSRNQEVVDARKVFWHILKHKTNHSPNALGKMVAAFDERPHQYNRSTVIMAVKQANNLLSALDDAGKEFTENYKEVVDRTDYFQHQRAYVNNAKEIKELLKIPV